MTIKAEIEPAELSEDIEVVSPGQMLQEARVAAKLSQGQVAERLKLRLQVIVDIEADSFDSGLSTTFVKGYLRAYARLLNVSEDLVLSSYTHLHDAQEQRTEMQSFSGRIKQETHDSRLMKFTYLVAFGIVVLLVMWWWQEKNQQSLFDSPEPSVVETSDSPIIDPIAPSLENQDVLEPQSENFLEPQHSETVSEESASVEQVTEPVEVETQAEAAPEQANTVNTPVNDTDQAEPLSAELNTVVEPVNQVQSAAAETQQTPAANFTALTMSFDNECWVEVRDADGKRLVADIKKAGQSLSVSGPAPYSIVLGTNAGVSVKYGQENIDLSSFKGGKVVRMTIPNN
ncbi:hypothetical protein AHAT_15360 [Agarivorans sp. Toyoura001]|uniref:cytoskeleton protein RodZ n=1 Tax=Agarivorans sp. Toyoura001 TaxID=2283141 RepID=UPI0010E2F867|nr:cytoskeleton protein RodZ [Agarivorans sp. Toyoura001]GDY25646.1 hypothetical protein AHAT_15360 [Agarivorans sp. Toyoura001]